MRNTIQLPAGDPRTDTDLPDAGDGARSNIRKLRNRWPAGEPTRSSTGPEPEGHWTPSERRILSKLETLYPELDATWREWQARANRANHALPIRALDYCQEVFECLRQLDTLWQLGAGGGRVPPLLGGRLILWSTARNVSAWSAFSGRLWNWLAARGRGLGETFKDALVSQSNADAFDAIVDLACATLPPEEGLTLGELLAKHEVPALRGAGAHLLGRVGARQASTARGILLELLADRDSGVRDAALSSLDELWDDKFRPVVVGIATVDSSSVVRESAKDILARRPIRIRS